MKIVSRKYRSKQKLSRKRNSKKRLSNKKYGGHPEESNYSPEATSQGDKNTEDFMSKILLSASEKGRQFEDHSTYRQYWLEQVIPSLEMYIEEQNNQGELTQNYYSKILNGIADLKYYIQTQSSYDFVIDSKND
jgi:hypothetical protein